MLCFLSFSMQNALFVKQDFIWTHWMQLLFVEKEQLTTAWLIDKTLTFARNARTPFICSIRYATLTSRLRIVMCTMESKGILVRVVFKDFTTSNSQLSVFERTLKRTASLTQLMLRNVKCADLAFIMWSMNASQSPPLSPTASNSPLMFVRCVKKGTW